MMLTGRRRAGLPLERQEELRLGALWSARHFDRLMIGEPVRLHRRLTISNALASKLGFETVFKYRRTCMLANE